MLDPAQESGPRVPFTEAPVKAILLSHTWLFETPLVALLNPVLHGTHLICQETGQFLLIIPVISVKTVVFLRNNTTDP